METEVGYIKAQPGYYIANYEHDYKDPECRLKIYLEPIIAWKIQGKSVIPFCASGAAEKGAIVYPDGRVGRFGKLHTSKIYVQDSELRFLESTEAWLENLSKDPGIKEATKRVRELIGREKNNPATK